MAPTSLKIVGVLKVREEENERGERNEMGGHAVKNKRENRQAWKERGGEREIWDGKKVTAIGREAGFNILGRSEMGWSCQKITSRTGRRAASVWEGASEERFPAKRGRR
jgi:hypothetical protein